MSENYSLDSEEAVKLYAHVVMARASELAYVGALDILPPEQRAQVEQRMKELLPYLRKNMLFQFEDRHPSLSGRVLAEIERQSATDEEKRG